MLTYPAGVRNVGNRCVGNLQNYEDMTTEDLELLLEARAESPGLEFKGAGPFAVEMLAKDILAMGNLEDGGDIVIGVRNATFEREGLTESQAASYNVDEMRDKMARYADPHVQFTAECVLDKGGKRFVVIHVQAFEEVPVICRVDDKRAGLRAATIYYRGSHRRPESAPVANSYDLRNIIDAAVIRMMRRRLKAGYVARPTEASPFDKELGGL